MAEYHSEPKRWPIQNYSRFKPNANIRAPGCNVLEGSNGKWITEKASSVSSISLSLTRDGHLFITQGDVLLESIFLPNSGENSRSSKVYQKDNGLLFLNEICEESRMFRVQFQKYGCKTAESQCKDCAKALSSYFCCKSAGNEICSTPKEKNVETIAKPSSQTSSLSTVAMMESCLMKSDLCDLPLIYKQCTFDARLDKESSIEPFLSLCLADPNFPSFVGLVESALKNIIGEANDNEVE
ncbi:unnamed protein product [Clavelina lepadiformis]|uniref:Meiotic recombination protein REC114 n=1 Tax=Clavelina lepadiformis TaxID=159417 RepID=A0ABP0GSD8_CLALP